MHQGAYPNFVNSAVDLSIEMEYEKQKLYEKREKDKALNENNMNETHKKSPLMGTPPKKHSKKIPSKQEVSTEGSGSNDKERPTEEGKGWFIL